MSFRSTALAALLAASVAAAAPLELTASKTSLLAGQDSQTTLTVRGAEGGQVRLQCSTGEVSAPKRGADGAFTATFTPPATREVAFVLCAAFAPQMEDGLAAISLSLLRREPLSLTGLPPLARVEVRLGDQVFGPVRSNGEGKAEIDLLVGPRYAEAEVVTTVSGQPPQSRKERLAVTSADQLVVFPTGGTLIANGVSSVRLFLATLSAQGLVQDLSPSVGAGGGVRAQVTKLGAGLYRAELVASPRPAAAEVPYSVKARSARPFTGRLKLLPGVKPFVSLKASGETLLADGLSTAELQIRVADEKGRPLEDQNIRLSADRGLVGAVVEREAGLYVAPFTAVSGQRTTARVTATVSGGDPASVGFELLPAPRLSAAIDSRLLVADGESKTRVRAVVRGGDGALAADGTVVTFRASSGSVPSEVSTSGGRAEAEFTAPIVAGLTELVVGLPGGESERLSVTLIPGPPARLTISPERPNVECTEQASVRLRVELKDAFGNGIEHGALSLGVDGPGAVEPAASLGSGVYVSRYQPPERCPVSSVRVKAEAAGGLRADAAVGLLEPVAQSGEAAISARLIFGHNLGRLFSQGAEIEGDTQLFFLPKVVNLFLLAGGRTARISASGTSSSGRAFDLTGRALLGTLSVGPRVRLFATERLAMHLAGGFDVHLAAFQFSSGGTSGDESAVAPGGHLRLSADLPAGPGAFTVQGRFAFARVGGSSSFEGQVGGLDVAVGYRLDL